MDERSNLLLGLVLLDDVGAGLLRPGTSDGLAWAAGNERIREEKSDESLAHRSNSKTSGNEDRVVRRGALRFRPACRVVVERDRLARRSGRGGQRMRMAVKRRVGRREDHRPVEERQDLRAAGRLVAFPKLEMAAI